MGTELLIADCRAASGGYHRGVSTVIATRSATGWNTPGMRRVRLLLWHLFRKTPLHLPIDEAAEQTAAAHCKMNWDDYLRIKREHRELWWRSARKRIEAIRRGSWPEQPAQLRRARKVLAPRRALWKRPRHKFGEWAAKALLRQRSYTQDWRRQQVLDQLLMQVTIPRHELRRRLAGELVD